MMRCPRCDSETEWIAKAKNWLCDRCGILWRFVPHVRPTNES